MSAAFSSMFLSYNTELAKNFFVQPNRTGYGLSPYPVRFANLDLNEVYFGHAQINSLALGLKIDMPSVSVVIPVFNRQLRLQRAIESVFRQTYSDFELIVVDDGSTIDLANVKQLVEARDHRWLQLPERVGVAGARNQGVAAAKGEWIAFLDSDDDWHPDKLAAQKVWHQENPDFRISQVSEQWFRNDQPFKKPNHLLQLGGDIFAASIDRCVIGPSCVMMHRGLWDEFTGFNPNLPVCEDYELWLRITAKENVGLVDGPALVTKRGGYSDQLSFITPAMDSYRMVALAELLNQHNLSEQQSHLVRLGLEKRASILAKGAKKRQQMLWFEFFKTLEIPLSESSVGRLKEFWQT